ncbi:hypothetical protein [Roseixanthobacter liquoris]|uniref:hypothetical protein n=1 Tax=Roseixanthobacter liquoris TaxID=3119921 RepID=UPI003729E2B5
MEIIKKNTLENAPKYKEAEIRFHIIDPILRHLGYPDSEDVYLFLEEKLEYPYFHIGGRSPKKDLPLGFPDYRAGLKGARGSFIVEAKAGRVPITKLEVEQAHSYASHAQVGANFFILCNGIEIKIYGTLSGPNADPITSIAISKINDKFHELENILSPKSLEKNCAIRFDKKLKLCDGLSSSARLRSGQYNLSDYYYTIYLNDEKITDEMISLIPEFSTMTQQLDLLKTHFDLQVTDGNIERMEDGRIVADMYFRGVTKENDAAMKMMGIDHAFFATADEFLSKNETNPTIFESTKDFSVSKGAMMPRTLFGGLTEAECDLSGDLFIKAAMSFDGRSISGKYLALAQYNAKLNIYQKLKLETEFFGKFNLILDH